MWCRHCQQDVPAIAQWADGPLVCPRCQFGLDQQPASNAGVNLASFDLPPIEESICTNIPRIDDESLAQLRDIGRKLRAPQRVELSPITSRSLQALVPPIAASTIDPDNYRTHRTGAGWTISFLLFSGIVTFAVGIALMTWSAAGGAADWYGALVATLAGEGALIVGLSWMAVRLWKNSRRVNRQLAGVEGQLTDICLATGDLAAARMTNSQAYYQHFGSAASPPLALANLRGQLDELTTRLAA